MPRGRRVDKNKAEDVKEELQHHGVLHDDYKPLHEDDAVIFPVTDEYDGPTVERRFERFETTPSFEEVATTILTADEQDAFIGSYDVIGDIALIQVPDSLEHKADELGEALLQANPHLATVRRRDTPRSGEYRLRRTAYLAGEDRTETTHAEHGVDLHVDIDDVYFSPRLSTERHRIASLVQPGEDILVLFGGCAPYACIIAAHSDVERVTSVEWNPRGHELAVQNARENGFADTVTCVHGDVEDVVPGNDRYDRVVMPAPHSAPSHVKLLDDALREGGTAHVYRFEENSGVDTAWLRDVSGSVDVEHVEHCGDKNPAVRRVCYDIVVSRR